MKCLALRRPARGWSRAGNQTPRRSVLLAMRRALVVLPALLLALASAACGDDQKVASDGSTTSTTGPAVPGRAADVVLAITSGGGFVPFGTDFANVPLKVQRDGTVYTGGAVRAIYPGPALTPVMTGRVSVSELAHVLDEAKAAGLAEERLDAGEPGVTDMPTTTITVELDGQVHEHAVYALDFGTDPTMGAPSGLTPAQSDVRAKLSAFQTEVADLVLRTADQPYVPTAYQVLASIADPAAGTSDVTPNELTWPVADVALVEGRCVDVDAAHAPALADLLDQATQITIWHDDTGAAWHLVVRATLPGDEPCDPPQD
jgi:hypothetical protein